MPNINALIARGGGYQPPSFDYATSQQNKLNQETRGLQNQLLQQQIAAQPEQQKLEAEKMQLKEALLGLREKALELAKKGELKPISTQITAGGETYELSGPPEAVARVSEKLAKGIDYLDESTIPWAAGEGVGIKKVEAKAPVMGTPEHLKAFDEQERIKAKYKDKPDKTTALQEKIAEIKAAYPGMDTNTARRIATGTLKVVTDPLTNNFALVDVGAEEQIPLTVRGGMAPPETPPEEPIAKTIWDMSDLGTGIWSAGRSVASIPSGTFGGPVAGKTIRARQFISSAQNDLIRALSINPRFPVGEINRLKKEIDISPKFFDNPKMMKERIIAVDDYLRRRLEKEQMVSADNLMPMSDRKAASSAASDIKSFLKLLGAPQGGTAMPTVTNQEEYDAIPSGSQYMDPQGNLRTKR